MFWGWWSLLAGPATGSILMFEVGRSCARFLVAWTIVSQVVVAGHRIYPAFPVRPFTQSYAYQ
jgi:hypothetical protein